MIPAGWSTCSYRDYSEPRHPEVGAHPERARDELAAPTPLSCRGTVAPSATADGVLGLEGSMLRPGRLRRGPISLSCAAAGWYRRRKRSPACGYRTGMARCTGGSSPRPGCRPTRLHRQADRPPAPAGAAVHRMGWCRSTCTARTHPDSLRRNNPAGFWISRISQLPSTARRYGPSTCASPPSSSVVELHVPAVAATEVRFRCGNSPAWISFPMAALARSKPPRAREVPGWATRGGSRVPGWERRRTRERSAGCFSRCIGS